jgi:F-type H+-transporting ATPase subunit b
MLPMGIVCKRKLKINMLTLGNFTSAASFCPGLVILLTSAELMLATITFVNVGFGINTNIFETNIINLAVVVGIVVSFVGNNLSALLDDRKKTILSNLEEANQRALEAQEKFNNAKAQLGFANKKAQEIRAEGVSRATNEINTVVSLHEIRLAKLGEFQNETVQFYQQKAFKEAYLYVLSRIMSRVRDRLSRGSFTWTKGEDSTFHVVVNNYYVSRFVNK